MHPLVPPLPKALGRGGELNVTLVTDPWVVTFADGWRPAGAPPIGDALAPPGAHLAQRRRGSSSLQSPSVGHRDLPRTGQWVASDIHGDGTHCRKVIASAAWSYFIRSWILARAARAHSSSKLPPGAPLTPNPAIAVPPAMTVTPPTAYVTFGSCVCGTVLAGALPIRSATAFVLSSLRASVSDADEYAL